MKQQVKNIPLVGCLLMGLFLIPSGARATVKISEFLAKNETGLTTATGAYVDWIEIHNDSGAVVDLAGWYLTDDPADLRKWQFPSTGATSPLADGGYLLVFADDSPDSVVGNEIHASFKLSSSGEYLALIESDGETVAYQYNPSYPGQSADISYGIDSGTGDHAFFFNPTPGTANGQAITDRVKFSSSSHAFTTAFSLELTVASPAALIRYTLDGTMPTASSSLYLAPFTINSTTRIRARTFESGLVNGAVVSEAYYHVDASAAAFSSDLPLVVLDNFGAPQTIPGPWHPTRQPCGLMIIEPVAGLTRLTHSPTITSRAGIRRRGDSSLRAETQKPNISLETWGEVDEDSRSIKPLGMSAESDWVLFAPYNFDRALMRNTFIYEVSNEAGRYAVQTRFVEVFLNHGGGSLTASDYYGVYVLMEKIKRDANRVDVEPLPSTVNAGPDISGGYIFKKDRVETTNQSFDAAGKTLTSVYPKTMPPAQLSWLTAHLNLIDAAVPFGNYESLLDVESFADHHILNVFANNADGLRLSTYYHKTRNGLLQMGPIWDFDRAMGCDNDPRTSDPEVWSLATDTLAFFHNGSSLLWFREFALNDSDFWVVWVDRWQRMRQGPLSDAAIHARVEGYRTELSSAALRNFERWVNQGANSILPSGWAGKVDVFKNHLLTRASWIDEQLVDAPIFNQGEGGLVPAGFELDMSSLEATYYTLDGTDPRASGGSAVGNLYSAPVTITQNIRVKARAWNGETFNNAPSRWPWSALTDVMYVVDPAPLAITEIMYHPRPPQGAAELGFGASDFEFIEIKNTSASVCSLVGVQFLDGVGFDFTYGNSDTLGAGAYGLVVRNLDAFKARYTNWASLNLLGVFSGRLSNSTEPIKLGYTPTNMVPLAAFDYEDDWYPSTDGEGFSLVLKDAQSAPSSWDSKTAWRHSSGVDGSPGAADPAPAYAPGSIVINEVLTHQDADNPGDWIELRNTTASSIDISGWFLSDSRGNLKKYTLPGGTIIPANGYLVLTEYSHFGAAFALSEHGDSVYLSAGSGGVLSEPAYRENESFGAQERDVTFGRHVRSDGVVDFPTQSAPTMGSVNSGPLVGPVVITQIMYNPPQGGHEYVEILNTSAAPVNLYDPANPSNVWTLSGIGFGFPVGTQLAAGEGLLLVRDTIAPAAFRSEFKIPAGLQIFSYSGKLKNDSDTLVLKKPGSPEAGTGYVPYIVVEQVKYKDSAPWPTSPDGLGQALERINLSSYANDVANWQAANSDYVPILYSLVVISGAGSGVYTGATEVPLQSDVTNESFVRWIGNVSGIADVLNPVSNLTMPAQDSTITALFALPTTLVAEGATWKYHDLGQNLGTAWQAVGYNDAGWASGAAQLGYNDTDTVTEVGYGPDSANKYPTTYFRKSFMVENASSFESLVLELLRDDGAVVYLNGAEVVRDNMPAGAIDYLTYASTTVGGSGENTFYSFNLSSTNLVEGTNVLAVESHQKAPNSSDLSFALRLRGIPSIDLVTQDGDADGMYDDWEVNYFGSTEQALPNIDPDGDGFVNSSEFIAGTLPTDATSFFQIDDFDGTELIWTSVAGRTYSVYWAKDLYSSFDPMALDIVGGSYTGTHSSTNAVGFYQIKVRLE